MLLQLLCCPIIFSIMKKLFTLVSLFTIAVGSAQNIGDFESVRPVTNQNINFTFTIPSTHIFQRIIQRGNASALGVDADNYDFTGFVPTNGSSTEGVIALNHETSPGGVSLISVQFNPENNLWQVDSIRTVDFSGVAGTVRNCSGGTTSWGTSITSEESISTADENNDGHNDIGWQIEIDVTTGKIMDYNNDGTPDKLYELGNFSHENIVVANDGSVAYEGADMGSNGYVYKFVPNVAKNLSIGNLYVLKLNNDDLTQANAGQWVQIPNKSPEERNNTVALAEAAGATNFNGVEDVEIGPDGFMYFTAKGTDRVYRFMEGNTVTDVAAFNIHIDNVDYDIDGAATTFQDPDNLAFDNQGNLYIMQDGGNNYIWVTGPKHSLQNPDIRIFANTPSGSESTGMTFSPDGNFMFVSIQHPAQFNFIPQTDANGDSVFFTDDITMVIARKEVLGEDATSTVGITENEGFKALNIYPNPVKNNGIISFDAEKNSQAQLTIVSINGKLQSSKTVDLIAGNNKINLAVNNLLPGQYVAMLRVDGKTLASTFVKN